MKKIYTIMFAVSMVLVVGALVSLFVFGLNFGVDFKGGSVLELSFLQQRPDSQALVQAISKIKPSEINISPTGDRGFIVRMEELSETEHQQVISTLKQNFPDSGLNELRFESVGPTVGAELQRKSIVAMVIVLIAILAYIAITFRKLSKTLSLWAMAVGTVVGLLHDIIIPIGVFALLGHFYGVQIGAVFVAAALTILGYTVSDKVVIYDRVRENILKGSKENLASIVHLSVMQTLVRSINNTLTVILSSAAIYFFGGESIRYFALALIVGIAAGAYSSIFVASPILVWWSRAGRQAGEFAKKRG